MDELVILVDSREPSPEHDPPTALFVPTIYRSVDKGVGTIDDLATRRVTLFTGDYSLPGLESLAVIERKTLADLIGTLFGRAEDSVGGALPNIDRFRAELDRLAEIRARGGFATIVLEASREDVWAQRYKSRVAPVSVINFVDSFAVDYAVPTLWAGNRESAQLHVGTTLSRIWEQHRGIGSAYAKAVSRGRAASLPWIQGPLRERVPSEGA